MNIYELYINGELCDLPSEPAVSLVYKSGIFSELDEIQSNRSHNIDLPITPRNIAVVQYAQRPDMDSDAPYVKLPASLYQNGIPLFTYGYAVITGISDVISVTLTWGNVDNFDPLFDSDMSDLSETLYDMGLGSVEWNGGSQLATMPAQGSPPKQIGFFGVNFGQGVQNGGNNMRYMHPCISVDAVLAAIERYNGITIDGKERLYGNGEYPNLLPCVSKKGNEESGKAEITTCKLQPRNESGYTILYLRDAIGAHPILKDGGIDTTNLKHLEIRVNFSIIRSYVHDVFNNIYCYICNGRDYANPIIRIPVNAIGLTGNTMEIKADTIVILDKKLNNLPSDTKLRLTLLSKEQASYIPTIDGVINDGFLSYSGYPFNEVVFPSIYPIGINLPDMSQGEFLSSLLTQAGLFAYADKDKPNTIKLMSSDELIGNTQKGAFVDWSSKILLNDRHLIDMPDSSEFIIGDYARKNTLDYDNDDDVKSDTAGEILIDNINLDKETELASLSFSASENEINGDGEPIAVVPLYTSDNSNVRYSSLSPRILTQYPTTNQIMAGMFSPLQKFGGEKGIVATKYKGLQDILRRLRIITVRAKLSALDLMNLDFKIPVYISQFGQFFGIFEIVTSENGICECQLVKLSVAGPTIDYYLLLDDDDNDITFENISAAGDNSVFVNIETNGTPYIVSLDSRLTASINKYDLGLGLDIVVPENTQTAAITYDPIVIGIREDSSKRHSVTIKQLAATAKYYLTIDGTEGDLVFVNQPAAGVTLTLAVESNGTVEVVSQDSHLTVALSAANNTLTITVPKNTVNFPRIFLPVVLGVKEDSSIKCKVEISQKAASISPTENYSVMLSNQTTGLVTFRDSTGGIREISPNFNVVVTIGGADCQIMFDHSIQNVVIFTSDNSSSVWSAIDIPAGLPLKIDTSRWLAACAAGKNSFLVLG